MLEEAIPQLVNYGGLGVCVAILLWDKFQTQVKLSNVVENNTIALTKVYEIVQNCKKK